MDDDLSYLEQLMGGAALDSADEAGGVWVVSTRGALDDAVLRLVGKARVVADALGTYVYILATGIDGDAGQRAIAAGADRVALASGMPSVSDLAEFFSARSPHLILFERTPSGRTLGPGLAQVLGGSLCGYAADLAVDPIYQRIQAYQPVLGGDHRQLLTLLNAPAVAVVDTWALPAAFSESWRTGQVDDTGLVWEPAPEHPAREWPARALTLGTAPVVVAAGRGLRDADGFALAAQLAGALGGLVAGDIGALDMGWIGEDDLVGLTGHQVAPRLYLALGIDGDTEHLAAVQGASTVVAVQPDPTAPITKFADWNVIANPKEFAAALLKKISS